MVRGVTLPELVTVTTIVGLLAAVVTPPAARFLDRAAVAEGADRVAAVHAATRQLAISRSALARYELDGARRAITVSVRRSRSAWDSVESRSLGSATVRASQRTVTFTPLGVGYGASNTRIVFVRGAASETLFVSRSGRLRRD